MSGNKFKPSNMEDALKKMPFRRKIEKNVTYGWGGEERENETW